MPILVFDIETVPDISSAKKLHDFSGLSDAEIANALFLLQRQASHGNDFLRLHLQRVIAISLVLYDQNHLKVWSLGEVNATEDDILQRFFQGIEKYQPQLVSWNGGGFDLPVLHYRSLLHGVSAPTYWETGNELNQFRWNNYLNRYHERHLDLMDYLALYQARANAPLDDIATMLGFPGKMGMSGAKVWDAYQQGELPAIRNYCETDVLNTFLVYLRFQLIRGQLTREHYQQQCDRLRHYLQHENKPHLNEFLQAWHI
ncbi:MAG: 3'-5' exonuclease [Legionellales bacterium]|nr:3'-5' exonuclease [Legionellales bacterium]